MDKNLLMRYIHDYICINSSPLHVERVMAQGIAFLLDRKSSDPWARSRGEYLERLEMCLVNYIYLIDLIALFNI